MNKILRVFLSAIIIGTLCLVAIPLDEVLATSSLTTYSSSSDGDTWKGGAIYANARTSTTGTVDHALSSTVGQQLFVGQFSVMRSFLYFDTSVIPTNANIYSVVLSIYGDADYSTADFDITVTNGQPIYPHTPLATGDYDMTNYSGSGGTRNTAIFIEGGYNDITLNATGRSWITKGGITKLALMSSEDIGNSAPGGLEFVSYYSGNSATDKPKLVITYTSLPVIVLNAATSVLDTTAQLNANVTDVGGDVAQVRWGYGKTSQTAANFENYTTKTAWAGAWGAPSFPFYLLISLDKNTKYYFRVQARNCLGIPVNGDVEGSFTTLIGAPSINSDVPNEVAATSAKLNAIVTDDGGIGCTVSWGYGTTSQTAANFALYDVTTVASGAWTTGSAPFYNTSTTAGLVEGTVYYYRVQINNSTGTMTSAVEQTFTTASSIGDIASFTGSPSNTSISLSWVLGTGDSNATIYYKTTPYTDPNPTLVTNGSFESAAAPPTLDDWAVAGAGATGERSNVQHKSGAYSGLLTRAGADCSLWESNAGFATYRGLNVTWGAWIYATVANRACLEVYDGVGTGTSAYHTGVAGWQWISVTRLVDGAASELTFRTCVKNGNTTAYFDASRAIVGTAIPAEGTLIYSGSNLNYTHTGLSAGKTYYYVAFGESGGIYSPNQKSLILTTFGTSATSLSTGGSILVPPDVPGLNQTTDATRLSRLEPFYSLINNFATSWGMPNNSMWVIIVLIVIAVIGLLILIESRSLVAATVVMSGLMIGCVIMQILPTWMVVVVVLMLLGSWAANHNFG